MPESGQTFSGLERSKRLHILLIDDDLDVQVLVRLMMQGWGHDCSAASSVEEARRLIESNLPDIALLDLALPGTHGLVFLEELLAQGLDPRRVVLISATFPEQLNELAAEFGVAYIAKPFSESDLRAVVAKALSD